MSEETNEARPQVLVVDDSRVIRVAAKKILKEEFDVFEAGDGEAAWDILCQNQEIALVISDLSMPYLNGMGLLKRIREAEDKRLANIPVIIVEAKNGRVALRVSEFIRPQKLVLIPLPEIFNVRGIAGTTIENVSAFEAGTESGNEVHPKG